MKAHHFSHPHMELLMIRHLILPAALLLLYGTPARAQDVNVTMSAPAKHQAPKRTYVPVCAAGVTTYDAIKDVPKPYDSLDVPPPDGPIMVTNESEAEAAALAMRGRAGGVGATGVVVTDQTEDNGSGMVRMRRSIQGVYVPADSARAQKACGK